MQNQDKHHRPSGIYQQKKAAFCQRQMLRMWHISLSYHLKEMLAGHRRFENAFQGVIRMILEKPAEKIVHAGKSTYNYPFFRICFASVF